MTAAEARKLTSQAIAEDTQDELGSLFESIEDGASAGDYLLTIDDLSTGAQKELTKLGYEVSYCEQDREYTIIWGTEDDSGHSSGNKS